MSRSYLPLELRKVFAGRSAVLGAMELLRPAAEQDGQGPAFQSVSQLALGHVTDPNSPDATSLESFLTAGADRVRGLDHPGVHRNQSALVRAIGQAEQALRQPTCSECGRRHSRTCDGRPEDDDLIAAAVAGPCLRPLVDAFRLANREAWAYYQRFCPWPDHLVRPTVHLRTVNSVTTHTFGRACAVGGRVLFDDTGPALVSVVELLVNVEKLDFESLAALPYVLLHECVCHAYSGIRPDSGARRITSTADRFAEGWMDWVANEICGRLADGESLAGNRLLTNDESAAGQAVHLARWSAPSGTASPDTRAAGSRTVGVRAAAGLLAFLRARLGRQEGWETFLRLTFDLNTNPQYHWPRQRFAEALSGWLNDPDEKNVLLERIMTYAGGGRLEQLFPIFSSGMAGN